MKCKDCQIEKDIYEFYFRKESSKYRTNCKECVKNDKIDIDLIYNHKNIVNSFATKVNLKKFTGPEYTGV